MRRVRAKLHRRSRSMRCAAWAWWTRGPAVWWCRRAWVKRARRERDSRTVLLQGRFGDPVGDGAQRRAAILAVLLRVFEHRKLRVRRGAVAHDGAATHDLGKA